MSALLLTAVLLPAAGALAALVAGPARGELAGRAATLAGAAAAVLSVVLLVAVVAAGPVAAVIERAGGEALAGLHADRLGAVLLVLVTGVSGVVLAFARRYLRGDVRSARFFAAAGLLTAASAALVTAATLVGLAVAWTVAGVALCLLLGLYRGLPAADEGVRRTVRAFAIGDGALWLAVAVATATWGTLDLRTLGTAGADLAADGTALAVVACLIVVAALARSAQLPLQGWLPATLAAPTPVSALLHAGVVNAGGVLLVTLAPLFAASALATHLAFAAGAATAAYGTALMLAKPDVKGALAHSTMGQMGFMVMTCGLGAFAAAIVHLVAHGMYKASLFLGSGSAVRSAVRHAKAPPAPALAPGARNRAAVVAALAPALALAAASALLYADAVGAGAALLLFAWATAAWAAWGWLRRHPSASGALVAVAAVTVACFGYVALLSGATAFLAPAVGPESAAVSPWLLVALAGGLAAVSAARLAPARFAEAHKTLYVLALGAGHVTAAPLRRAARRGPLPGLAPAAAFGRTAEARS